jgi:deoxyribodipyrimidine photo-lyase
VEVRVRSLNHFPLRRNGRYVLYWSQMNRRVEQNHALSHAIELANSLSLPVLFYEALGCTYPYANDRMHTFLLEGVPETAKRVRQLGIGYLFHLRKRRSDPNDALYQLASHAAAVVTDDYPVFVASRHNSSAPARVGVPYLAVDSSCIVPMNLMEKREYAAYTIRPKIKKLLPRFLTPVVLPKIQVCWNPLQALPADFQVEVTEVGGAGDVSRLVAECEIEHTVKPSTAFRGGRKEVESRLSRFLEHSLRRYPNGRNEPSEHATSNMSPYLHFGHVSALELALEVKRYAAEHKLIDEEYLEELIVRRELAFNYCRYTSESEGGPGQLTHLPDWARKTLGEHARDTRNPLYTREEFEKARTHDSLWNATQKEMLFRGKIHGYYRMYWGKKIIEWSPTCQDALETMIYLHDRYALDGRDPNTYTNILWCFGLHDRPWTERPVFGQIRWMSLDGMKRKTDVDAYLREIGYLEATGRDPLAI